MAWQPIETAPRDDIEIIVGMRIASVWVTRNARFVRAEEWVPNDDDETDGWWSPCNSVGQEKLEGIHEPTHWMPQPDPPRDR